MRILFLSHYFPPEVNAPASRTYEHCRRWGEAGHEVTVVTCVPNCPQGVVFEGYRNRFRRQVDTVDGIQVVRIWSYLAPNAGTLRRILNFLSYMLFAVWTSLWLPRPDVIVATSPQFFCGWAGVLVSWFKRKPLVLEIRDLWPDSITAVGAMKTRPLMRILEWLERKMYRSASQIVTVGPGYRERILEKTPEVPIAVITNGVDPEQFLPQPPDREFQARWNLEGKFVCSYVGTIGMAHGLEVVIEAAKHLRSLGRDDIVFLLVGDGAQRKTLEDAVVAKDLTQCVVFTGLLPRRLMPQVLANSSACLIHLRSCELFEDVIPSKMFEIMAMQRPIIMGVKGGARQMVLDGGAGLPMEPDSAHSLLACLIQLADSPGLCQKLGQNARGHVTQHYGRETLALMYLDLLINITKGKHTSPDATPLNPEACALEQTVS